MEEKRKLIFVILLSLSGIFFLTRIFYIPLIKDIAQNKAIYRQLKTETDIMAAFSKKELDGLDGQLNSAISSIEDKFLLQGASRIMAELTRVPKGSGMVFTDIAQKQPQEQQDYQLLPVEVYLKATFSQLMYYLSEIESSPLLLSIDNLSIRRIGQDTENLDIRATFLGFRLVKKSLALNAYLEEKYKPFDRERLVELLKPVRQIDTRGALAALKEQNPFAVIKNDFPGIIAVDSLKTKPASLVLQGVMRVSAKKVALINNNMVREGDSIGGMKVVEIGDFKVILADSEKRYILKMGADNEFTKP